MEKLVNLFIPGFAKSGTTALYHYLNTHPDIFFPVLKEPHYFARDFDEYRNIRRAIDYKRLFIKDSKTHYRGDASVFYLYSDVAIKRIHRYNPYAKFIVCMRNPIEMAQSLHTQFVFTYFEKFKDFEQAWHLQDLRKEGRFVAKGCPDKRFLYYLQCCSIGTQLQKLYRLYPKENILCLFQDELRSDMRSQYLKIMKFLNIPDDGRTDFPIINEAVQRKDNFISKLLMANSPFKRRMKQMIRYAFPNLPMGFAAKFAGKIEERPQHNLSKEFLNELETAFEPEISLVEKLTGADLSHWRRKETENIDKKTLKSAQG